jgi:AraC family transcriptional activator of pobA
LDFSTKCVHKALMASHPLPQFFLYGEPLREADPNFLHVEDLAARSRPGNWRIAPHKHADLNHLLLITDGGGTIVFEAETIPFAAPVLLAVPARAVHGFAWDRESAGHVLTIADVQLHRMTSTYRDFAPVFAEPRCIALTAAEADEIDRAIGGIARELSWAGLGQAAALDAGLLHVLVLAARRLQQAQPPAGGSQKQRELVARFRSMVEDRYRLREPMGTYARALGVSETSLRDACAATGQSPSAIRDQRALLEAQRLLAFSALGIGEVAESVGIADPAYFSRFFTRHCGTSPARWRAKARARGAAHSG